MTRRTQFIVSHTDEQPGEEVPGQGPEVSSIGASVPTVLGCTTLQQGVPAVSGYAILQQGVPTVSGCTTLRQGVLTVLGCSTLRQGAPMVLGCATIWPGAPMVSGCATLWSGVPMVLVGVHHCLAGVCVQQPGSSLNFSSGFYGSLSA